MVRCVKRGDLDVKKWDNCIQEAHNGRLYGMSYYLDSVCASYSWIALIYNDYEAVMPLPLNKRIPLFTRIMLPHFAQQLGVFSKSTISANLVADFISAIPSQYKSVYVQLNDANRIEPMPGIETATRANYVLQLTQDYDSLYKAYSTNIKRNIKKAAKFELSKSELSVEAFIPFYLAHEKSSYTSKSTTMDVLSELLPTLLEKDLATIYCVRDQDQSILASCVITRFQKRMTYLMAKSSPAGKEKRAMHWLINQIIMDNCTAMDYLDFEGSDIPSIAQFFSFFGAEVHNYSLVKYDRFPFSWIG